MHDLGHSTLTPISRAAIIIPARDEEQTLGPCLAAVRAAVEHVQRTDPVGVEVVVVANACRDRTVNVARRHDAHVLSLREGNVGAARRLGAEWALRHGPLGLWLATTDADSRVPRQWLAAHLRAARTADLYLGTVELEPHEAKQHATWVVEYRSKAASQIHGHIHGANLGVRADLYDSVGGFADLQVHEDRDLVTRLLAAGGRPAWSASAPVVTSARHDARSPLGVSEDLRQSVTATAVTFPAPSCAHHTA